MPRGAKQTRIRVEQLLAFGRSDKWITETLGVTVAEIDAARARLDAAVAEDAVVT